MSYIPYAGFRKGDMVEKSANGEPWGHVATLSIPENACRFMEALTTPMSLHGNRCRFRVVSAGGKKVKLIQPE